MPRLALWVLLGPAALRPLADFVLGAAAAADCLPHCTNPCAELNGNLKLECGACVSGCHPGADDFGDRPPKASLDGPPPSPAGAAFASTTTTGASPPLA